MTSSAEQRGRAISEAEKGGGTMTKVESGGIVKSGVEQAGGVMPMARLCNIMTSCLGQEWWEMAPAGLGARSSPSWLQPPWACLLPLPTPRPPFSSS